jgi:hypothetical protein
VNPRIIRKYTVTFHDGTAEVHPAASMERVEDEYVVNPAPDTYVGYHVSHVRSMKEEPIDPA